MSEIKYSKLRWFILLSMYVAIAASAVALISPTPMVEAISKTLGVSLGAATGIAMGSFNLFVAFGALGGGVLLDKIGPAKVWLIGLSLIIIGGFLIATIGGTATGLNVARAIQGLGTGPLMASAPMVAALWFPPTQRSFVTGVQGFSMATGIIVGFTVGPQIFMKTGNWQLTMAILTVFAMIGLVLAIISTIVGKEAPGVVNNETADASVSTTAAEDLKIAMSLPTTWAVILCVFLVSWAYQGFNDMTPGYIAVDPPTGLGRGVVAAGALMVGAQIANMAGSLGGGFITEKFFKGSTKTVIALAFALFALCVALLKVPAVYSNQSSLFISLTLAGFFMSFVNPQALGFIARFYPTHIVGKLGGTAMGLGIFGGTAGVTAGSYFLHTTGLYSMSVMVVVIVSILGLITALFLKPIKAFDKKIVGDNTVVVESNNMVNTK